MYEFSLGDETLGLKEREIASPFDDPPWLNSQCIRFTEERRQ